MPPTISKRSSASKGGSRDRRSSSRHSSPLSNLRDTASPTPRTASPKTSTPSAGPASTLPRETAYIHTATSAIVSSDPSIEALVEKSGGAVSKGDPPSSRELHALHDKICDGVQRIIAKRGEVCDRSMRQLAQRRKERLQAERDEAARAEEAARVKQEEEEGEKRKSKNLGKKRSHEQMMDADDEMAEQKERQERRESLPSVGAHGVARQDGVGVHEGQPAPPSPIIAPGGGMGQMDAADSPSDSEETRTAPPKGAPLYELAFGKDPTKSDDPTVYEIHELRDDMTEEEIREVLNVAHWPDSDLRDLTAGDPPDKDFSNAKPANQVNFSTFQTYAEPFIRPFTEEDVAFLKERGDRFTPYVIPQRGNRSYKEVWAAEDGDAGIVPPRKTEPHPNEPRGSMEDMNDDTAETDEVSMGPVMNRLLSIVRPTPTNPKKDRPDEDAEGDISMTNGEGDAADSNPPGAAEEHKPFTALPTTISTPQTPFPPPSTDYASLETRVLQELRHIGFLGPTERPDYASHTDDEVAARLRTLQHELRNVSRTNNVRRARVLELAEERMAMQEYANIADDLDNQVNAAYLKRNRSLAKPNNRKGGSSQHRPGGQKGVAAAVSGRGVSEGVKALMQKRRDWVEMVGPVVGYGRPPIPGDGETVFDEASLKRLERVEREEGEAQDGEGGE